VGAAVLALTGVAFVCCQSPQPPVMRCVVDRAADAGADASPDGAIDASIVCVGTTVIVGAPFGGNVAIGAGGTAGIGLVGNGGFGDGGFANGVGNGTDVGGFGTATGGMGAGGIAPGIITGSGGLVIGIAGTTGIGFPVVLPGTGATGF